MVIVARLSALFHNRRIGDVAGSQIDMRFTWASFAA